MSLPNQDICSLSRGIWCWSDRPQASPKGWKIFYDHILLTVSRMGLMQRGAFWFSFTLSTACKGNINLDTPAEVQIPSFSTAVHSLGTRRGWAGPCPLFNFFSFNSIYFSLSGPLEDLVTILFVFFFFSEYRFIVWVSVWHLSFCTKTLIPQPVNKQKPGFFSCKLHFSYSRFL